MALLLTGDLGLDRGIIQWYIRMYPIMKKSRGKKAENGSWRYAVVVESTGLHEVGILVFDDQIGEPSVESHPGGGVV